MKTKASIFRTAPGTYETVDLDLEQPRQGEILVRMVSSGLCHSDDHVSRGDIPVGIYPFCGGHEGAGIVEQVGQNTPGWETGDHVVFTFLPSCGRCKWCALGMQNLCNTGALTLYGSRFDDEKSYRMHLDGQPVGQMASISTFSEFTVVSTLSAIKVPRDVPLARLALLGCGVSTGWGSAVNAAGVAPGQTTIVMGCGGIGVSAIQGAVHSGAASVIAVDPIPFKRQKALEFGATEAVATMEEAGELAQSKTDGQGADSAMVMVGVTTGEHVGLALDVIRKGGSVVVTGAGVYKVAPVPINLVDLVMSQKRIVGSLFGSASPLNTIPTLVKMYVEGHLKLDEMVTRVYSLDEIAQGFEDMHAGTIIRGVVDF